MFFLWTNRAGRWWSGSLVLSPRHTTCHGWLVVKEMGHSAGRCQQDRPALAYQSHTFLGADYMQSLVMIFFAVSPLDTHTHTHKPCQMPFIYKDIMNYVCVTRHFINCEVWSVGRFYFLCNTLAGLGKLCSSNPVNITCLFLNYLITVRSKMKIKTFPFLTSQIIMYKYTVFQSRQSRTRFEHLL